MKIEFNYIKNGKSILKILSHFTEILRNDNFEEYKQQCDKIKDVFNELNLKILEINEKLKNEGLNDICFYINEIQKNEKKKIENVFLFFYPFKIFIDY